MFDALLARSAARRGVDGLHTLSLACAHASLAHALAAASSSPRRSRSRCLDGAALSLQRARGFGCLARGAGGADRCFCARLLRMAEAVDVFHPVSPFQRRATD